MCNRVIYPGSFDPVTLGHVDIIERASKMFDEVIIAVSHNHVKNYLFTSKERVSLLNEALKHLDNVVVKENEMLVVDFAEAEKSKKILRGLRAMTDFEFEFQLTLANKKLAPEIETVFLVTSEKYSYVSSSLVKELAQFGKDISEFAPKLVCNTLKEKFKKTLSS